MLQYPQTLVSSRGLGGQSSYNFIYCIFVLPLFTVTGVNAEKVYSGQKEKKVSREGLTAYYKLLKLKKINITVSLTLYTV